MNRVAKIVSSKSLFDIWLVAATVLYVVIFALTPMSLDDYTYSFGTAGIDLAADKAAVIWHNCADHWQYDTGRLANLLSPIFLGLLPKIAFSIISGLLIWLSVRLMCKLAGAERGSLGSWVIALLTTFALPWFDYMFSVMFAINYVWPSALTLLTVYWILDYAPSQKRLSPLRMAGMCMVAMLAGWMHEGFSVPVIAGFTVLWLLPGHRPDRRQLLLLVSFAIGALLIVIAPAFWARTSHSESQFLRMPLTESLLHGVGFNFLFFLFFVFLLVGSFSHRFRNILKNNRQLFDLTVFVAVSSIVASAIFYIFYTGPRMGWYATQFCTIGTVALGRFTFRPLKRRSANIIAVLIAVLTTVNLAAGVVEQRHLYRENEEIVNLFLQSYDGEVYYDNMPTHLSASMLKSSMRNFNEYMPMELFSQYWRKDGVMLSLLPSQLQDFTGDKARRCSSDSTLYLVGSLLLSRDSMPDNYSKIQIKSPELGWTESRMRPRLFTARDSTRWILIVPHVTLMTGCTVTDAKWK